MQANGIGSVVSFFAVLAAAICAECIPVMFCAVLVSLVGIAWDFARGNVTGKRKRKSRHVSSSHLAAGRKAKIQHHHCMAKERICQDVSKSIRPSRDPKHGANRHAGRKGSSGIPMPGMR